VRSSDRELQDLIGVAAQQSQTFKELLAGVETTNGIVYVEPGKCSHGVHACLQFWMKVSGPNRFMRISIDRSMHHTDIETMSSIGHELQHAIEVLREPSIRDGVTMFNFFKQIAPTDNNRFETTAAVNAGDAVYDELRKSSAHHVRAADRRIIAIFEGGMSRSATFRLLVDTLDRSDVIVYVYPKTTTRQALGGYLTHNVVVAGGYRYVHIAVNQSGAQDRLVSLLAHELQHAVEIAQDPNARDEHSVQQLFDRLAVEFGCDNTTCFETKAAKDVETIVGAELKTLR
jgi:hypothetical protein